MLSVELVAIPVKTEEILRRSKGFKIGMHKFIDYFAGTLLLFDFLIEVEEYVRIVRKGSVEVELESLR